MDVASGRGHLPYRADCDEHPGNQPGQDQFTDDDRIDIAMDSLEHNPLTHLSSACTDGCSASSCVV
jgi:hypothetical protein